MAVFDPLVRIAYGSDGEPGLALSWENTSPYRWVFHLRDNVTFHNGRAFSAEDVAKVLNYLKTKEATKYLIASEMRHIATVRALDSLTVEIRTSVPDAILPRRLTFVMMVEPDLWSELGVDEFTAAPIGTGPYQLIDWGHGNAAATLKPHATSWRKPKADVEVVYLAVRDRTSRLQSLASGDVDVITGLHVDDVAELEALGFQVHVQSNGQIKSIALPNVKEGDHPLKSAQVRRALNMAIDKNAISKFILNGMVQVASQGAAPGVFGYNPDLAPYPYDPIAARRLITEAGYPSGFSLGIGVLTASTTPDDTVFQKVAQDLRQIGLVVELRQLPYSDFLRRFNSGRWEDLDAFTLIWNNATFQDSIWPIEYFSCLRANPFFCDTELTPMILESKQEMDSAKREAIQRNIMARLHHLAPAIWLTDSVHVIAATKEVAGLSLQPTGLEIENLTRTIKTKINRGSRTRLNWKTKKIDDRPP